jgi:hypothetical protein
MRELRAEVIEGCRNEESLPYMILSAPHRDAATAGARLTETRLQPANARSKSSLSHNHSEYGPVRSRPALFSSCHTNRSKTME